MPITYLPFSTTEPRPTPPSDYLNVPTNPREFGAGIAAAEEKLGAGATTAGRFYGEVAADQATNNWQAETTKLLYGDPNVPDDRGFYGLKGQAAMDAMPTISAKIEQLRNQMRDQLTTPNSQLQFDGYTRRLQNYLNGEIGRHYDQQSDVWATDQNKNSASLAHNWISSHASDPEQVEHGISDLMRAELRQLQIVGGAKPGDDAVNATLLRARQEGTKTQIQSLLGTNPAMASQVFNDPKVKGLLSGAPGFDALDNAIRTHATRALGDDAFMRASGGAVSRPSGTPGAVIPFNPSPQLLSGTGMSSGQYDTYRRYLAGRESGSYSEPPNQEGYMGRYQMGPEEIKASAARLGIAAPSQSEFLSNPQLQEQLFANYTEANHAQLMSNPTYAKAAPEEKAAILAGAHLGGVTGVQRYLAGTGDAADRLGTHVSSYVNGMMLAQAGTPFSRSGATPNAAAPQIPGIAQAEAHYASTIASLNADPTLQGNPEAYQHALQKAEAQLHSQTILAASLVREHKVIADSAADAYVQNMMKPGTDMPGLIDQIRTDPNLDKADRENLWKLVESHSIGDALGQQKKDGPGITDALNRVTADDGDPNRLASPRDVIKLGIPDATGTSPLSPSGVVRVLQALKDVKGSPAATGIQKIQNGAMAYAKHQLSFEADYGTFKVRDPKGEDAFNIGFTPAFFKYWENGVAAGKTPQEMADKSEIDKLVQPFKRSPADEMRDKLDAGEETKPQTLKVPTADDLAKMGPQELVAAVRTNPALRSQAEALALKNGWIRATPAPPIGGQGAAAAPLPPPP